MAAKSGKLVLLQLGSGVSAVTIASARTNSFTINNSIVDTTTKKDGGWGSTLSGGGVREMTVSLEGVFDDAETYDQTLRGYGIDGSSNEYTMITSNGDTFVGNFVITSYTVGGTYNEAETFSMSLRNDGAIVYTAAP